MKKIIPVFFVLIVAFVVSQAFVAYSRMNEQQKTAANTMSAFTLMHSAAGK